VGENHPTYQHGAARVFQIQYIFYERFYIRLSCIHGLYPVRCSFPFHQ